MNQFIEQFRDLSTEYLLERRALGEDGLAPEAHRAIEQLLSERGVPIPPMPSRPILSAQQSSDLPRAVTARNVVLAVGAVVALAIAKALAATWAGLVATAAIGIYFLIDWLRRRSLSDTERTAEDIQSTAERNGLTDLMKSAGEGDSRRVKELIAYGANVNARSNLGSTALMYAAKNGHIEIASVLLEAGADATLRTHKGSSASDFAAKAGYGELARHLAGRKRSPPEGQGRG